jgi:hypothetical protein
MAKNKKAKEPKLKVYHVSSGTLNLICYAASEAQAQELFRQHLGLVDNLSVTKMRRKFGPRVLAASVKDKRDEFYPDSNKVAGQ